MQSNPWREYQETHCEDAFAHVVEAHAQVVYSAALRKSRGDANLAEEIAQAVFTDIARRPEIVPADAVLEGWLYRHTCFKASQTIRDLSRKRQREEKAVKMCAMDLGDEDPWGVISPLLDELMEKLKESERDALVLRFLKGLDLRSVGHSLGISEDAAQKKVSRALDSLRGLFMQRGIPITAAVLAVSLESNAKAQVSTLLIGTLARIAGGAASQKALVATAVMKGAAMKIQQLAIGALLLGGTLSVLLVKQQSTIRSLKKEKAATEQLANDRLGAAQRGRAAVSSALAVSGEEAARAEHLELMRLRAEVTELRRKQQILSESNVDTNSLDHILKVLWDTEESQAADHRRYEAAKQLASLGPDATQALTSFREMLHSGNLETRYSGARALAFISEASPEAFQELSNALSDPDPGVRQAATFGFGIIVTSNSKKLDGDSTIPMLIQNLRDSSETVRQSAASTLMLYRQAQTWVGKAGQPDLVIPALIETLQDPFRYARQYAVRALEEYGPDAQVAVPQITKLLDDPDSQVRTAAKAALQLIAKRNATKAK